MRRLLAFCVFGLASLSGLATAQAGVEARVDLAAQRMIVRTSDGETHNWAISSGRKGYRTPTGTYRPIRLEKKWYSRKYGGNMPNAVFFRGGYAVHATGAIGARGAAGGNAGNGGVGLDEDVAVDGAHQACGVGHAGAGGGVRCAGAAGCDAVAVYEHAAGAGAVAAGCGAGVLCGGEGDVAPGDDAYACVCGD